MNVSSSQAPAAIIACDNCHKKVSFPWRVVRRGSSSLSRQRDIPTHTRGEQQKIKCDGLKPCTHCLQAGKECTIEREFKKRGPRTKKYIQSLEERLEYLESMLGPEDREEEDLGSYGDFREELERGEARHTKKRARTYSSDDEGEGSGDDESDFVREDSELLLSGSTSALNGAAVSSANGIISPGLQSNLMFQPIASPATQLTSSLSTTVAPQALLYSSVNTASLAPRNLNAVSSGSNGMEKVPNLTTSMPKTTGGPNSPTTSSTSSFGPGNQLAVRSLLDIAVSS
jgi:hypothetical protein